jgi:hypothetical protein
MGGDDASDLPLFTGPHVARNRFARALDRLDLQSALADAPAEWREAVAGLAAALGSVGPARAELPRLVACRRAAWPSDLERAWQRLVGRCLDAHGIPGSLDGEPAAAFLLRGGDRGRAARSIRRHLDRHPHDAAGWKVMAEFEPVRATARGAFHGGPVLDGYAGPLLDLIAEDEHDPPGPWLLSYAWFIRTIDLEEIGRALAAQGILSRPPLLLPGDAYAFTWYLLDARGRPLGRESVGVVEARQRLQQISPAAFRRYLDRVAGR